jgi:hypothetical protein
LEKREEEETGGGEEEERFLAEDDKDTHKRLRLVIDKFASARERRCITNRC